MFGRTVIGVLVAAGSLLCGCAKPDAARACEEMRREEQNVYLLSQIEDVDSLAFATRFVDSSTPDGRLLLETFDGMLSLKLLDLAQFLPASGDIQVVETACRVAEGASEHIFLATNSCTEGSSCEHLKAVAQLCVEAGFATAEDIAIPGEN